MDSNDISDISEKVEQAIKCAKKLLIPLGDGLIVQEKRKIETISEENIPRRKYKPLYQRKRKHSYSERVGKKAEMMRQFYKAKISIGKGAEE